MLVHLVFACRSVAPFFWTEAPARLDDGLLMKPGKRLHNFFNPGVLARISVFKHYSLLKQG